MLGEKELHELGILNWSALAGNFNMADLLLGNGFSVNITSRLDYNSLFDEFLKRGSSKEARIFESFGTNNFELILEKLLNAKDVNEIFKIDTSGIEDSIECLKVGLIKTIEAVHPRWAEADHEKLQQIAMQLNRFNDVFTLNYDLYLYRIILVLKDKYRHGEKSDNIVIIFGTITINSSCVLRVPKNSKVIGIHTICMERFFSSKSRSMN